MTEHGVYAARITYINPDGTPSKSLVFKGPLIVEAWHHKNKDGDYNYVQIGTISEDSNED